MADTKISALPASTTPLAGTEVVPLVQSSTTKQVSVANLTAGRVVAMSGATVRNTAPIINFVTTAGEDITGYVYNAIDVGSGGKLVFGTKRNGDSAVDRFSINAAGNLTQLVAGNGLNFTANTPAAGMTSQLLNWYEEGTWTPSLGGDTTYTTQTGKYTRIGRMVYVQCVIYVTSIGSGSATTVSGLPFTASGSGSMVCTFAAINTSVVSLNGYIASGGTTIAMQGATAAAASNFTSVSTFKNSAYVEMIGSYMCA